MLVLVASASMDGGIGCVIGKTLVLIAAPIGAQRASPSINGGWNGCTALASAALLVLRELSIIVVVCCLLCCSYC